MYILMNMSKPKHFMKIWISAISFWPESALALLEYFKKDKESKVFQSIVKKVRVASDNSYYILALMDRLSSGEEIKSIRVNPYMQEVFLDGHNLSPKGETASISRSTYHLRYAYPTSSFLKFKAATVLFDTKNYGLSKEILDKFSNNDLFYMDSIVEKTYAIEQLYSDKTALKYIEKYIGDGYKNARLLKTYGSLQRSQRLYKESKVLYWSDWGSKKRVTYRAFVANLFLRGISLSDPRIGHWKRTL